MWRFSGFDSAWGGRQAGAVCHLDQRDDERLELDEPTWSSSVTWGDAAHRLVGSKVTGEAHVIAIDQPLVVPNEQGSRPVDVQLARALMRDYAVGAHAANRANPRFGDDAGVWRLLDALEAQGYLHQPGALGRECPGRYFFECYPNLAIIGWLDCLPRYKVRHRDVDAWLRIIDFLRDLSAAKLAIVNASRAIPHDLPQTKANEDRIDALIAAYTAAWHWHYRGERSVVIGDRLTGYIVTPVNPAMRKLLAGAPAQGATRPAIQKPRVSSARTPAPAPRAVRMPGALVTLVCADTSNLWGKYNPWMSRFEGAELVVRFIEEDGEPTVRFRPFASGSAQQRGMKVSASPDDRARWEALAGGTSASSPRSFQVEYSYEMPSSGDDDNIVNS
jgi:predicted RNase H-like nuclease